MTQGKVLSIKETLKQAKQTRYYEPEIYKIKEDEEKECLYDDDGGAYEYGYDE